MKIEIDVNEEQFKTLVEKSLFDLSPEKLQEVVIAGLHNYLSNEMNVDKLIFDNQGYYSSKSLRPEFRKVLEAALKRDEVLQTIADDFCEKLHKKHKAFIQGAVIDLMINGMMNNTTLKERFRQVLWEVRSREANG